MDSKTVGKFIATQRKKLDMTQMDLAKELNVSDKTISKWEGGNGYPDINQLPRLSKLFNVTVDELLTGELKENISNLSLMESAVKIGGMNGVKELMKKNPDIIRHTDEFNKDIIDYAIKYQEISIIQYLFETELLRVRNNKIVSTVGWKGIETPWPKNENSRIVKRKQRDTKVDDIVELLILGKEYAIVRNYIYIGNMKSLIKDTTNIYKRKDFFKALKSNTISEILGPKTLSLSDVFLKKWVKDFDPKMISLICGFETDIETNNYTKIAEAIGKYASKKDKENFIRLVYEYNIKQQEFAKNPIACEHVKLKMSVALYLPWMIDKSVSVPEFAQQIGQISSPALMSEKQFSKLADKYGTSIFLKQFIRYIISYHIKHTKDIEFLQFVSNLYTKSTMKYFPILSVIKKSKKIPELEEDIILYCHQYNPRFLYKGRDEFTTYNLNDVDHIGNPRMKQAYEFAIYNLQFLDRDQDYYNGEDAVDVLTYIFEYGSDSIIQEVVDCFNTKTQTKVLQRFINTGNINCVRRFLEQEQTKAEWDDSSVKALAKNRELLMQTIDILNTDILDEVFNNYCDDNDFELMRLLIDHGAMYLTQYSIEQGDGEESWKELVTMRDKKRTTITREMLKTIKK